MWPSTLAMLVGLAGATSSGAPLPAQGAQYFPPDGSIELGDYFGAWRLVPADGGGPPQGTSGRPVMFPAALDDMGAEPAAGGAWLWREFFVPAAACTGDWMLVSPWAAGRVELWFNGRRVWAGATSGPWRVVVPGAVLRRGRVNNVAVRLASGPRAERPRFSPISLKLRPATAADFCDVAAVARLAAPGRFRALVRLKNRHRQPVDARVAVVAFDLRPLAEGRCTVKPHAAASLSLAGPDVDERYMVVRATLTARDRRLRPAEVVRFVRCDDRAGLRQAVLLSGTWQVASFGEPGPSPPPHVPAPLRRQETLWKPYPVPHWGREPFREFGSQRALWFRCRFDNPHLSTDRVAVRFEAVRHSCDVYLNGRYLATHHEGYSPFSVDVTGLLQERNELVVRLLPPRFAKDEAGRFVVPYYYGPEIWQDVWLEGRPAVSVVHTAVRTSWRRRRILVVLEVANSSPRPASVAASAEVWDGDRRVLRLPPTRGLVRPGRTARLTSSALWPRPKLYWPHEPHMYALRVCLSNSDGRVIDRTSVRFGFREVWVSGADVMFSGRRLVLRKGPWAPGGRWVHGPDEVFEIMGAGPNEDCRAVRFHHSPPPPYYLDAADLTGVLVEEESVVYGARYAWSNERFWKAFADHWSGLVRRDINHPSLILYSVENESYVETLPRGRAPCDEKRPLARKLADIGRLLTRLDPTRPINYEGDGDLLGLAPIVNLHYPRWISSDPEFPARTRRPFDEMGKPLIIGEFAYRLTANPPRGLTSIMGPAAMRAKLWRMGLAEAVREMVEGYKLTGVDGYSAWDAPRLGTDPPVCIIMDSYCQHLWAGEDVDMPVWLVNSTLRRLAATLRWRLWVGGNRHPAAAGQARAVLEPNRPAAAVVRFRAPRVAGASRRARLELTLYAGGALRYRLPWALRIYPPAPGCRSAKVSGSRLEPVALYDPAGTLVACFAAQSPRLARISRITPEALGGRRGLLVAPGTPPTDLARACRVVEGFCKAGGRVAVVNQPAPLSWLPRPLYIAPEYRGSIAFAVADHPVLAGLDDFDLRWWRPDMRVAVRPVLLPKDAPDVRALVRSGGGLGLVWAPLVVESCGRGAVLVCQMPLATAAGGGKLGEPAAWLLLGNIVHWLAGARRVPDGFRVPAANTAASRPIVSTVLPAAQAAAFRDVGARSLPPAGHKIARPLAELRDRGDAVQFVVPEGLPAGVYEILVWIRTGERAPRDRVASYQVSVGGRAWRLAPAAFEPIFSHSGGQWAVWYGYGAVPDRVRLRGGQRIIITAGRRWLYVGHVLLRRAVR